MRTSPLFRPLWANFLLYLLCSVPALASRFYVSPSGAPSGTGTITEPWDLQTALDHPAAVKPGDTIWLRGGVYWGNPHAGPNDVAAFVSRINGTKDKPVVVRQYPGERAILDGGNRPHPVSPDQNVDSYTLGILGDYTWFWGFEITNSNTHARSDSSASFRWRVRSLVVLGKGTRMINLVVHDTGNGIEPFSGCSECEIYGCIVFYNGWSRLGIRGHGEGIYSQNIAPEKYIRDNIVFKQFDSGIILYGSSNAVINNFVVEGNIVFDNGTVNDDPNGWGFLFGKSNTATGPGKNYLIRQNYLYNRFGYLRSNNMDLGYQSGLENVYLLENYSVGRWSARYNIPVVGLTAKDNTLIGDIDAVAASQIPPADNTIAPQGVFPIYNDVFVRPNLYEAGRAHIVAFNGAQKPQIEVDLSSLNLNPDDYFEVFDVQNLFGAPVRTGFYDGSPISLPTYLTEVTPVIGEKVPRPAVHTDPVFNAYLLVRKEKPVNATSEGRPTSSIKYYWNPADGILHIESGSNEPARIRIFDVRGRLFFDRGFTGPGVDQSTDFLNSGIYFFQISTPKGGVGGKIQVR